MKKGILATALICAIGAASAQAEQPGMSQSKLSSLGLASFEPASDDAGMEVRGMGRSFAAGAFISTAGTAGAGILSYAFANRRPGAVSNGQGFSVSNFSQVYNGTNFVFSSQALGSSSAFGP